MLELQKHAACVFTFYPVLTAHSRVGGCGTVGAQCVEICDGTIAIRLEPGIWALSPGKTLPLQPSNRSLSSISSSIAVVPIYFEESWAILSSICLMDVVFDFMIIGITTFTPISVVPIVVCRFSSFHLLFPFFFQSIRFRNSNQVMLKLLQCFAAGAIANGLCQFAFYAHHPTENTVIAATVADVAWL